MAYVPILLTFRDQVEFRSEMATGGSRVSSEGDSTTRRVHGVVFIATEKSSNIPVNVHFFPNFSLRPL